MSSAEAGWCPEALSRHSNVVEKTNIKQQLLKLKQDRVCQYIEELDTLLNNAKKARLGVQKSMDLVKTKPGRKEEDTLIWDKAGEESQENGGFT